MPIRDYLCKNCGFTSELLVGIGRNSDEIACKSCGSKELEELISVPARPVVNHDHGNIGSTCCGGNPSDKGCVPGSCCGSS